ncbi:MAG: nuclear transport factor 2 family protein [Vicinamibacterales bacterium]
MNRPVVVLTVALGCVGAGCAGARDAVDSQELHATEEAETMTSSDLDVLLDLNREYIRSVQESDVERFREMLAEDFRVSNPDGSFLDKAGFLAQTARPVTISNLEALDVEVRIFGDTAIIHARTSYTGPDGRLLSGRYTDVWVRRDGRWLAVAAHVTRGS